MLHHSKCEALNMYCVVYWVRNMLSNDTQSVRAPFNVRSTLRWFNLCSMISTWIFYTQTQFMKLQSIKLWFAWQLIDLVAKSNLSRKILSIRWYVLVSCETISNHFVLDCIMKSMPPTVWSDFFFDFTRHESNKLFKNLILCWCVSCVTKYRRDTYDFSPMWMSKLNSEDDRINFHFVWHWRNTPKNYWKKNHLKFEWNEKKNVNLSFSLWFEKLTKKKNEISVNIISICFGCPFMVTCV